MLTASRRSLHFWHRSWAGGKSVLCWKMCSIMFCFVLFRSWDGGGTGAQSEHDCGTNGT